MTHPASWYPDPTGRFEHRFWDGTQWTLHVATGGKQAPDPPIQKPPVKNRWSQRRARRAEHSAFTRRSLNLRGDRNAHHFIAMRAKEDGDYAKALNATLDMWDRFGFGWHVADALWDSFLVWEKTPDFEPREACELALEYYQRARTSLPADLAHAPMPQYDVTPQVDIVNDWISLFNLAEKYFGSLPEPDRRLRVQRFFDEVMALPPVLLGSYSNYLRRHHHKYGIGNIDAINLAEYEWLQWQNRGRGFD